MNLKMKTYLILCICFSVTLCANSVTEGMKVLTLEQQITAAAKMDFSNYKLYPFAITTKQQFSLSFIQQQNVKGQIRVNWIDLNKNQLSYPTYDETQYIRITIIDSKLNKTIQQRKFHFQTGINFHAQPNHRYKLIFTDFGNMNKMIQLTISKVEPLKIFQLASLNTKNSTQKTVTLSRQIHSELNILTVQARRSDLSMKNVYSYIIDSLSQYLIFSAWEVCLVAVMMVIQILMFRNLVKNNWSFV